MKLSDHFNFDYYAAQDVLSAANDTFTFTGLGTEDLSHFKVIAAYDVAKRQMELAYANIVPITALESMVMDLATKRGWEVSRTDETFGVTRITAADRVEYMKRAYDTLEKVRSKLDIIKAEDSPPTGPGTPLLHDTVLAEQDGEEHAAPEEVDFDLLMLQLGYAKRMFIAISDCAPALTDDFNKMAEYVKTNRAVPFAAYTTEYLRNRETLARAGIVTNESHLLENVSFEDFEAAETKLWAEAVAPLKAAAELLTTHGAAYLAAREDISAYGVNTKKIFHDPVITALHGMDDDNEIQEFALLSIQAQHFMDGTLQAKSEHLQEVALYLEAHAEYLDCFAVKFNPNDKQLVKTIENLSTEELRIRRVELNETTKILSTVSDHLGITDNIDPEMYTVIPKEFMGVTAPELLEMVRRETSPLSRLFDKNSSTDIKQLRAFRKEIAREYGITLEYPEVKPVFDKDATPLVQLEKGSVAEWAATAALRVPRERPIRNNEQAKSQAFGLLRKNEFSGRFDTEPTLGAIIDAPNALGPSKGHA